MISEVSIQELRDSIRESTRPIGVQINNIARKIDEVADIVRPIPAQIAKLDIQVEGLKDAKGSHDMKITGLTGKMQNIELTLASKTVPFWEGQNARQLILLAIIVVSGLIGLAGYKLGT